MIKIGYLHYRKKPDKLKKAYAFAAVAKAEGAELIYFSPGAVDYSIDFYLVYKRFEPGCRVCQPS